MSADYRIDIYTTAGAKIAEVVDYISLTYTRRVNAPGLLSFTLPGDHWVIDELEHNAPVIVYRRNAAIGLDWTADFWGLFRFQRRWYTDHPVFEARCPGIMAMLAWRIVAWYAGTNNISTFKNMPAETIMKTLVDYNAGPSATTANGRIRNGTISGLTVQTDGGGGNTISISCAWDNLLDVLQRIATIGGGDFDLIATAPTSWQFRWYAGQRGTDRTDTLLFALERGNMADPEYTYDRLDERTVGIVAGQGEGSERAVVVRTGPDYSTSNDIELYVDARHIDTTSGLNSAGDARMQEKRARGTFQFNVLQAPNAYYGVHYNLGDLVTAQYGDISVTQKVMEVSITVEASGAERIDVGMETI